MPQGTGPLPLLMLLIALLSASGCRSVMKMNACEAYQAAMLGNPRQVLSWLDQSTPDQWSCEGKPLLVLLSIPDEKLSYAKVMLSKGANPNAQTPDGRAALHMAAADLYNELIDLLLDAGADVNLAEQNGFTPLMEAADIGTGGGEHYVLATVELMLRRGANPGLKNKRGQTAKDLAQGRGNDRVVQLLDKVTPRS